MIKYFIGHRISAFMLCTAMVTAGIVSLFKLPISLLSSSDYPALTVIIEYPGISPDKIESLITKPVERIIKTVNGIVEISSVSEEGKSRINVTFRDGTDIKIASVKVRGKIELIKESFPAEVQEPVVLRYDPSERPVVIAAAEITGVDRNGVREILEKRVKPSLQRIDGISEIIIAGGELREIHVETDRAMSEGRGLTPSDISSAVSSGNISIPGGMVESGEGNSVLFIPSGYKSLLEIGSTSVFSQDGRNVRVSDVSEVRYGTREKEDLSRFNGTEMVTLYIHRGGGTNTLSVCRDVRKVLGSFSDINFKTIYDQGEYIEASVKNAVFAGIWGIIIVALVLSLFFRRSEEIIPVTLAIPASILAVPCFMYLGGTGINVMSISGFALGAGMVVDNGIVVMEAIRRNRGGMDSIVSSVGSVKLQVVSSTLTTISVFIPLMLISRKTGSAYSDMAFTVTAALLVSLFFSIVIVPAFYCVVSGKKNYQQEGSHFVKNNYTGKYTSNLLESIKSNISSFHSRIVRAELLVYKHYSGILDYAFDKRKPVLYIASMLFFAALVIITQIKNDSVSVNGDDEFYIYLEFPTGLSLEKTDIFVSRAEKQVRDTDGVRNVSAKTEKWRGTLTVKAAESLSYSRKKKLKELLKEKCNHTVKEGGGFAYISEADELASREITIHFIGDDDATLRSIARESAARINSIEGIAECMLRFREGMPEYTVLIDRDAAGRVGISHASVADTVRNYLFGPVITKYIEKGREVDVRFRLKDQDRTSIEHVFTGSVRSESGQLVPLSAVSAFSESSGATKMFRLNGRKCCSITARTGSLSFHEAERTIRSVLKSVDMPEGYSCEFDRRLGEIKNERRELIIAVVTSALLVYMILASLFESLKLPLLIMTTIPFAITGVAPVLFITGIPLSPAVFMGLIMLTGIVMNNGILLVDSVSISLKSREAMHGEKETIIKTVTKKRFRPVMITTVTTILGMAPMVFGTGEGSSLWRPFAVTVCSGLLFSTALTLVLIPLLCARYNNLISRELKNE